MKSPRAIPIEIRSGFSLKTLRAFLSLMEAKTGAGMAAPAQVLVYDDPASIMEMI
ncbi:hypothetical protein CA13_47570 [Planctomycetes bacterium CA13]|uniref:Uncharacterized protein n=1 Tax=Novipirellula herctigrandis TaxID=2527986 RepID=A0A5C5Z7I2_9BACT|nr:hypothetical protein CA13_47570 [Planctomycetes bacterium CA13]